MAKNDWWLKFEIHKWLNDPKVRRLSRANRDSWLTSLCMMRLDGSDRIEGTQPDLSNLLGLTLTEFFDFFHDLERSGAADVTRSSQNVTDGHAFVRDCPEVFTIMSRRFRKELSTKEKNRLRKESQRGHADVPPKSHDRVISKKKEVISKKKEEEKKATTTARETDDQWLDSLSQNPAYIGLGVRTEYAKAQTWADTNGRQCSRRFFVNWLNRVRPIQTNGNGHKPDVGRSTYTPKTYNCQKCMDTGEVSADDPEHPGELKWEPCPDCGVEVR
jgi:hypothetical protein